MRTTWTPKVYVDCYGRLGHFWWLWAIMLHTFGVQILLVVAQSDLNGSEYLDVVNASALSWQYGLLCS